MSTSEVTSADAPGRAPAPGANPPSSPRGGPDQDRYVFRVSTSLEDEPIIDMVLADCFGFEGIVAGPPELSVTEPGRNVVVEYDGEPVANVGAFSRMVTVPGAVLPAAHLTRGGVRQTHRRRGLMTRLMRWHLSQARDVHQEALAVWWASEAKIYQRYGSGLASINQRFSIDNRDVKVRVPEWDGRLREVPAMSALPDVRSVYESVRPHQPGWSSRPDPVWVLLLADPPPEFRQGWSAKRVVLAEGPDGVEGYAIWQRKQEWSGDIRNGEVNLVEIAASTPGAYAYLWQFLLSVDLTRTVKCDFRPLEDPLLLLVDEPRALYPSTTDGLWVRLLDLPTALTGRRYSNPLDVVIEVVDDLFPQNSGRWRLQAKDGTATCERTTDPADLAGSINVFSAIYLGGTTLTWLAAAGQARELRPGALAETDLAFSWPVKPTGLGIF
ncbi:UPF0256 protein [Catellatospora sp. TT07R-123]|uniref:GNAT family N-acetyltransferase n=1 Tax=Catellatospora sp. TT07R-123 TaxID=2733863 RepID=UPI001B04C0BB|nr:GNAT family N-acetyltransferase [Catellatospora sp. TT07R-123]GHJ44208.1 UPF0256 protein [Catellatospora sp. TT07R-123]